MRNIPTLNIGSAEVLALGCAGILIGVWLKKKLPILDRLCIPTSIVGGLVFALITLVLHDRVANFEFDTSLRDLFMIAFMTTVGLNARLSLLKRGGTPVLILLGVATGGAILQNLLGIGIAKSFRLSPLIGIVAGSVALAGGPATSLAFGPTFEKMGVVGATETGIAAATFGIAVSGLVAAYIGKTLIRRHKLRPATAEETSGPQHEIAQRRGSADLLQAIIVIGIAMGLGSLISRGFEHVHFILPSYIGALIAAVIVRNVMDASRRISLRQPAIDDCMLVSLYLFIVIAVLSLRLWVLAALAVPLIVILVLEVVLCWLMCVTLCFYAMGRDYRAAIVSSGFSGFMLGITANAVASMQELVEKFGPSPEAFFIVPVVGAFLIDLTNSIVITLMANLFR
ncbi:MAG TPA: sodium/glutamate symporter [Candidatus Acidoferrales bacterium]|nr:sodium/glutamate symporter [Candidatus Acidoferrales bacterium]